LELNVADIEVVMPAMRQLGVRSLGGAEALAIFQQCVYDLWKSGSLARPLARIKIDEKNCFGMLEWPAVREASMQALPRHAAVACWKHAAVSAVEQQGVADAPKDRGAEQGDVEGPLECSLTLGGVGSAARWAVHNAQRLGHLPWASDAEDTTRAAVEEFVQRGERHAAWSATTPALRRESGGANAIVPDPAHEVQAQGGLADYWYLDDGDILCDPRLVHPYLTSFDTVNPRVGAVRNRAKTEVIYYADTATLEANAAEWRVAEVEELATVSTAEVAVPTLGVATGSLAAVEQQLQQKIKVVKAMQERTVVCQDAQTEHVINRQCLGVGKANHIMRVHGDELVRHGEALNAFDDAGQESMDRLFPGLTAEGREQASLAAAVGGLGWRRAKDTARPANLGALVSAGPKVRAMAAAAVHAGLIGAGQVETILEERTLRVETAYLGGLDEAERMKAEEFLRRAKRAADEQLQAAVSGTNLRAQAPRIDARYDDQEGGSDDDVHDGGDGDAEGRGRGITGPHLQKELAKLQDCTRLRALEATLREQSNW
jgi:broad specificity phosphatase PhoE